MTLLFYEITEITEANRQLHVEDDYDMASRVANDFRLIVSTARALPADVTVGHPAFLRAVCLCCNLKRYINVIIITIIITPHSFIPGLKPPSSANPSHSSGPFLLKD